LLIHGWSSRYVQETGRTHRAVKPHFVDNEQHAPDECHALEEQHAPDERHALEEHHALAAHRAADPFSGRFEQLR
jgi:hypothetical protein